jgi:hypothetical protein
MTALYSLVAVLALAALGLSAGEIAGARVLFGRTRRWRSSWQASRTE